MENNMISNNSNINNTEITLLQALTAIDLTLDDDPVRVSETIAERFDLGRKSDRDYTNPIEAAIFHISLWENNHGYEPDILRLYLNTPLEKLPEAYFG